MYEIIAPLAFPQVGTTSETFDLIAAERFRNSAIEAVQLFAERGYLDSALTSWLRTQLREWEIPRECAWHFSCGIFNDHHEIQVDPARCADHLMVALAVAGFPLRHEFCSHRARVYTAQGQAIDTTYVRGFESSAGAIKYYNGTGDVVDITDWCSIASVTNFPSISVNARRIDFIVSELSDPVFTRRLEEDLFESASLPFSKFAQCLVEINERAPQYYEWCLTAVTSIIPVNPNNDAMISGSQGASPGQIYLNGNLNETKIAEMLVHEASHQYFMAIETVCRLAQLGTEEEFYSPVVERKRPLRKLLLAYHAFANVVLLMESLRDGADGCDLAFVESNIRKIHCDLASLAAGIDASKTLTEGGSLLWNVMKKAVHRS